MLKAIESKEQESSIGMEEASKRISELKEQFNQEYKELESKYEASRQRLQQQVDQLSERNQELELSLKIQVGDFEKEIASLREALQTSEEQKNKSLEQVKYLEG